MCEQNFFEDVNEFGYISKSDWHEVEIRMFNVKTVTQITNSADWFNNQCKKKRQGIKWTVFLCYDTDSHSRDVTKFYEGDWERLRQKLGARNVTVIDLSVHAMIEDLFLLDEEGICSYLGIPSQMIPKTGNAKRTLKDFFRNHKNTYHEGEKAKDLMWALDKDKIIKHSDIQFSQIEEKCFPCLIE